MRKTFLIALMLVVITGCAGSAKKPTQKELALQQWNQTRANMLLTLARDQYSIGNFDQSRKTVSEAMRIDPQNVALVILSARLSIEQGQLEAAEFELTRARQLDPQHAEVDYLSGVIYQRWQRPETAFEYYSSATQKAPSELPYLLAKCEMLVVMDRTAEALEELNARLPRFEHSAVVRDMAGQLLMQSGRYSEAVGMFRKAILLSPEDMNIREHLAMALLLSKQYRDAAEELRKLLRDSQYANRSDLLIALGQCQLELGQAREARRNFEAAAEINPNAPGVWLYLARAALALNEDRRADIAARRAAAVEPANPEAHLLVGYLRLRQGHSEEALASFRKAHALDRTDTVSLCMIGYALEKLGRADDAVSFYAQALKINPSDEMATKLLAAVELRE